MMKHARQHVKQEFLVVVVGCFLFGCFFFGCLVFFDFGLVGVLERLERIFAGMFATLS